MAELAEFNVGQVLSWSQVEAFHRSRNGIYQRGGDLCSLLTDFGKINPCYPDSAGADADTILYTGAGRRGDQKLDVYNRAMMEAMRSRKSVPLFCKIRVNHWEYLGLWMVEGAEFVLEQSRDRMVWQFTLKRDPGTQV